jgi:hypothetical protein
MSISVEEVLNVKDVEGLLRFGCVNNPDSNNYKNAVGPNLKC